MFKKMFALASVTALTGLVATVAAVGCSSTTTVAGTDTDSGTSGTVGKKDGSISPPMDDGGDTDTGTTSGGLPEEKTVGKECTSTADCKVAGSKNDNGCSKGFFQDGDLFGSPVCIEAKCTQGSGGTIGDLLCDDQTGLCLPTGGSDTMGICFPLCTFDSMSVTDKCAGGNKCNIAYLGTDTMTMKASAIGFCFGACQADADCKGTAGQKCQVEDGLCVNADKHVTYTAMGKACTRPPMNTPATCNCNFVGNFSDGGVSKDADKGFCTHSCVTGTAGDAVCAAAATAGALTGTWKCTAKLPTVDDKGAALFSAQPADVSGTCLQQCTADADCAALTTTVGAGLVHCKTFADGKYCDASPN